MIARRLITALLIALTVSGLFTFWLSRKVSKPRAAAVAQPKYVAAASNIDAGDVLHPTTVKLIEWGSTPLEGAFAKPEDVSGRAVLFPLAAGQPILERQLSPVGSAAGITVRIPEGMRAISVKSSEVTGVSGFLAPGARVDVLVTYHQTDTRDPITTTVLQDAQILAAGQKIQPDPEGKANTVDVVTLLVKPQDAERLVLATSQGDVHFVLRNSTDREQVKNSSVQLAQLADPNAVVTPAHVVAAPVSVARPKSLMPAAHVPQYEVLTITGNKSNTESFK